MAGKGLSWTAAHLRAAASPEDVRMAVAEAKSQLDDTAVPATTVLSYLEDIALDAARLRDEVRAATRARESLLAGVAHDLRNPLNTFAMSAGLLRDDLEGPDFDRTRALSLLSRMDRASSRMQALIDDLLEASRVEAGLIDLSPRPEEASVVARDAIAKVRLIVAEKGGSVEEGAIASEAPVELDRARTVDAIVRLVGATAKVLGDGLVVRIGVERDTSVRFTIRASSSRLRGVSASAVPHDETRGGLAFLIGRGLVASQGGTLTADTTQDGPRLVLSFPLRAT